MTKREPSEIRADIEQLFNNFNIIIGHKGNEMMASKVPSIQKAGTDFVSLILSVVKPKGLSHSMRIQGEKINPKSLKKYFPTNSVQQHLLDLCSEYKNAQSIER